MKRMLRILILVAALNPMGAFGQSKYDTKYVNQSLERLPPNYYGCDIISFHKKYLKQPETFDKSEFETMSEYQERLNRIKEPGVYAFRLPIQGDVVKYDAEFGGSFSIKIRPQENSSKYDDQPYFDEHRILTLKTLKKFGGSYLRQTQFGGPKKIQIIYITDYDITFSRQEVKGISFDPEGSLINLYFKCPPETAKVIKKNLNLLILCRPMFSGVKKKQTAPTFDYPYEERNIFNYLRTELSEIWVYDLGTGEILMKRKTKD
jgi:hypothetical protein